MAQKKYKTEANICKRENRRSAVNKAGGDRVCRLLCLFTLVHHPTSATLPSPAQMKSPGFSLCNIVCKPLIYIVPPNIHSCFLRCYVYFPNLNLK